MNTRLPTFKTISIQRPPLNIKLLKICIGNRGAAWPGGELGRGVVCLFDCLFVFVLFLFF